MQADESESHRVVRETGNSGRHRIVGGVSRLKNPPRRFYLHRVRQVTGRSSLAFIRAVENVVENDIAVLVV